MTDDEKIFREIDQRIEAIENRICELMQDIRTIRDGLEEGCRWRVNLLCDDWKYDKDGKPLSQPA